MTGEDSTSAYARMVSSHLEAIAFAKIRIYIYISEFGSTNTDTARRADSADAHFNMRNMHFPIHIVCRYAGIHTMIGACMYIDMYISAHVCAHASPNMADNDKYLYHRWFHWILSKASTGGSRQEVPACTWEPWPTNDCKHVNTPHDQAIIACTCMSQSHLVVTISSLYCFTPKRHGLICLAWVTLRDTWRLTNSHLSKTSQVH